MKVNTSSLKMDKIDEIYSQESVINIYYLDKDFLVVHINNSIFMPRPGVKEEH